MKMNIGQVVVSVQAINAILYETVDGRAIDRKLPFKVKMKLSKIKQKLQEDIDAYETQRQELVKEYGEETELEDGGRALEVKDPEKLKLFYDAVEEVLKTTVTHTYDKLTKEDIVAIEDLELDITELQLSALFMYIIEKE